MNGYYLFETAAVLTVPGNGASGKVFNKGGAPTICFLLKHTQSLICQSPTDAGEVRRNLRTKMFLRNFIHWRHNVVQSTKTKTKQKNPENNF